MLISRVSMVMVLLAAWATGSSAEILLPDFLSQTGDFARTSTQANGLEAASFLVDATASTPGLGWQLAATPLQALRRALPSSPQEADPAELLDALALLGHARVSITYFQALAEPSLFMADAGGGGPTPADRHPPGSKARPMSGATDSAYTYSAAASAKATKAVKADKADQRESWALPDGLAGDLWLYGVATASVAAAALGLARLNQSSGRTRSRRLARL